MVVASSWNLKNKARGKSARGRQAQAVMGCAALTALGMVLVAEAAGPQPTFLAAPGSPFDLAVENPSQAAVADVDGDGIPDVVTPHMFTPYLTIMRGLGDGTFEPATNYVLPSGGSSPGSVVIHDVNGDGHVDLVIANYLSDDVSVLEGNGTGEFVPAPGSPYALNGSEPGDVAVADFTGDGKPDIATCNFYSYSVSVLENKGVNGFEPLGDSPFEVGYYPLAIATADVNGDGEPDLVTSNLYGYVSILHGDGAGSFNPTEYAGVNGFLPVSIDIADLNGDGRLDLITANLATNDVSVLKGSASGFLPEDVSLFPVDGYSPQCANLADVNGDGKLDIVVGNDSDDVTLLLGDGTAQFILADASPIAVGGARPFSIVPVDVNGDTKPDLVTSNSFSDNFSVLLNTTVTDTTPPTGTPLAVGTVGASNGQAFVPVRLRDAGSGVKKVKLTPNSSNVHLEYPLGTPVSSPFTFPGPLADVTVFAVKNTNARARVELQIWDAANNTATVDPIVANLESKNGRPLYRTFKKIPQAERYVRLQNGAPGFTSAKLWINGRIVSQGKLTSGQAVDLDVVQWLKPGDRNTATILAAGPKGSTAILTIGDVPTGSNAAATPASGRTVNLEFSR